MLSRKGLHRRGALKQEIDTQIPVVEEKPIVEKVKPVKRTTKAKKSIKKVKK